MQKGIFSVSSFPQQEMNNIQIYIQAYNTQIWSGDQQQYIICISLIPAPITSTFNI